MARFVAAYSPATSGCILRKSRNLNRRSSGSESSGFTWTWATCRPAPSRRTKCVDSELTDRNSRPMARAASTLSRTPGGRPRLMSMIGLASIPGTPVDPTCSIRAVGTRPRSFLLRRTNSRGHPGSYGTTRTLSLARPSPVAGALRSFPSARRGRGAGTELLVKGQLGNGGKVPPSPFRHLLRSSLAAPVDEVRSEGIVPPETGPRPQCVVATPPMLEDPPNKTGTRREDREVARGIPHAAVFPIKDAADARIPRSVENMTRV